MNIQLQNIINDFLLFKGLYGQKAVLDLALEEALNWVNENVSSSVFNLAAIGSVNDVTHKEQDKQRAVLFQFLENAIDFKSSRAVFLSEYAPTIKAQTFDNSDVCTKNTHIYQSIHNLGVQEKYIRGLLTKTHWLTELDIQRQLKLYELNKTVKITPFTEPSLRATLALAVRDHHKAQEPFTIPLMLNRDSIGGSQGTHWLSAQVTINPTGHKICYRIDDSLALSVEEKQQYKAIIEEALVSKPEEFHNPFPSIEGWTLDPSEIHGHATQTDGYSCGYRALRQLLSNPAICGDNINAQRYAEIPLDSELLVRAFFYAQLRDLSVLVEVFNGLSSKGQELFADSFGSTSKVKVVDTEKLNSFLNGTDKLLKKEADKSHKKIEAVLGAWTQASSLLRFPEGAKDDSLTAVEYECFFSKLHDIEQIEQSNLKRINLPYVNKDSLDGISSYFALHPATAFKELGLFIDSDLSTNQEAFFSKLKLSISTLSKAGLEKIELRDELNKLSKETFDELKNFAMHVGLTCKIQLPGEYAVSALQRELDRIIELNQQQKNHRALAGEQSVRGEKSVTKSIRKREKLDFAHAKQVDIELQDSVEAEVALEMACDNVQERTEFASMPTVNLDDLRTAIRTNDFRAFADLNVMMTKEDFVNAWHQIFGNLVQGELQLGAKKWSTIGNQTVYPGLSISKISNKALHELLRDGHLPAGGIDFQNLPQGFVLINDDKKAGGRILHYDSGYKNNVLIAPSLTERQSPTPLIIDVVEEIIEALSVDHSLKAIWNTLNKSATYDANKHQIFREVVLEVLSLAHPDQDRLIELCGGVEGLDLDRLKSFFKNRSELASLSQEPFDAANILNVSLVERSLNLSGSDIGATRAGLIHLAAHAGTAATATHPLFTIIQTASTVIQLRDALDKYRLTSETLNDLTRVYSSYGPEGVNKVLRSWQATSELDAIKPKTVAQIIANSEPLKDIILSQDLHESCKRLNDFSKNKREWFLQLYANHSPKSDKNFVDLFKKFTAFSRTIENEYQLEFYTLTDIKNPFTANIDMRTAMGRITTILNACRQTDLGAQWARIAEIDLGPAAAINAVRPNAKNRQCSFVIPEMKISQDNEDLRRAPYDTAVSVNEIAPKTMNEKGQIVFNEDNVEAVQKRFFRYVAHQEHRMPLAFYTRAVAQIEEMGKLETKIDRSELNTLYKLLAETTTGKNYQYYVSDEQKTEKQWGNILENIKNSQLRLNPFMYAAACKLAGCDVNTRIYKEMITNLGKFNSVPSIEILDKLLILITSLITKYNKGTIGLKEFGISMERLGQSNDMLRKLTDKYHDKIYMGMNFYDADCFEKSYAVPKSMQKTYGTEVNLFDHHTLVANSISQKNERGFDKFAVPLISIFALDHDNIETLYACYQKANSPIKLSLMMNFGSILLDIQDNKGLSADLLRTLIDDLLQEDGAFALIEASINASVRDVSELEEKIRRNEVTEVELERFHNITLLKMYLGDRLSFDDDVYDDDVYDDDVYDDDVHQIINKLAKTQIAEFLETNTLLKKALPEGYAERLKSQKATGAVTLLIEEHFKTQELKKQIEQIRVKFSGLPENKQLEIIRAVSAILNHCDTESERQEVATTLANQQLLGEGAEAYSKLLNAIKRSGSTPFVYYIQQAQLYTARNNDKPIQELCEKSAYFIDDAIPNLANRYKNLNVVEFAPLIASVISAGGQKELIDKVEVGDSFAQWQSLSTKLSAARKDPDELAEIIAHLESGQKSRIADLNALQDHLSRLKNPTIIRVKVDTKEEKVQACGANSSSGLIDYTYETRQVTKPTNALRKFGAFLGISAAEKVVSAHFKIITTHKEVKDPAHLDADLVNSVLHQVQQQENASVTYGHALTESVAIIDRLIESYPTAKSMLLPLTKNYLEHKGDALATETHIKRVYGNLKNLAQQLALLNNKDTVISLCEHFSAEGKFKFTDLMTIFNGGALSVGENRVNFTGYPTLSESAKKQLFSIITSLLNNKKNCELADIEQMIALLHEDTANQYLESITAVYNKAPYPELSQFNQWAEASPCLEDIIRAYNTWSKNPVAREDGSEPGEEGVNGFNMEYAKEQRDKMSGIQYTDEELQDIKDTIEKMKHLTTNQLLERISEIRTNPEAAKPNPTELVAVMSELLYRTKGMPQEGVGNTRKWGNSFEINTTQYLAVHSLLKSDKPTIAGIGTGEGKSRIMMISLAAQWVLGRTVDFVTADVTLATRDYLEYQAYFKSFGAQTNLIIAQTPVDQYCKDGINFSDASNLSLFRNKARSCGFGDKVINPIKENRCLLLDEADKTLFDTIDTRYNYSAQADQSIQNMPWIYEGLVKFFKDPENEALFHGPNSNADECNRKFKEFVKANLSSEKDVQKLEQISRSQLESWQGSAITALNLEYGKDFTLEANVPIVTKKGPGIVSQARLISGGAASKNAKFSFGVHQCLHARLNLEKLQVVTEGSAKDNLLHEELNQKKYKNRRFPVDSENQIIYSSTSKALIDDYNVIRGVTGSPGAWTERAEKANMAFIDIPRHRGMNRIDRPYQLAKDTPMQFQQIIAEIRISITNNQPILLICKNDKESKQLYDYLATNLTTAEKSKLHRVSADTSIAEEAEHVENKAGKPGAITVTTARMGRGTDIKLHDDAKTNGLHVIGSFLPRERDYIQIIGRAGRFGAKGSSRLILNEESMREHFNSTENVPQEFYTATESYLDHLKMTMDIQIQKQRIIKDAVSDFRMNLTTSFFDQFFKPLTAMNDVNHELVIDRWRKFFDVSDKTWNETWPKISDALANKKMNQVENSLQDYHAEVQGYWKGMIDELKMDFADNNAVNFTVLPENVSNIKLSQRGIELLKYDVGTNKRFQTYIAERYDESYKGRAVILKGFFQNLWHNVLPSIFSWKDTVYTQARKNGNMTWSQFLLGGKLGTPVQTTEDKFVSTLDNKKAMELVDIEIKGSSTAKIFNLGVVTSPLPTVASSQESIKEPPSREEEPSQRKSNSFVDSAARQTHECSKNTI